MFQEVFYNLCLLYNATNKVLNPFQDGGGYHIETSPLICGANQWTCFYMITASVLKELKDWFGENKIFFKETY